MRPPRPQAPLRRAVTAAALTTALALSGCASTTQAGAEESSGAGYVAGDGSLATWEPQQRDGAIDLAGQTYDGEQVDLGQWRGEVVVVNFWYAACPPCRAEAGDLRAIHEDYTPHGVQLLGVNPRDDAATAQAFERTFAVPYPSIHDQGAAAVAAFQGLVPLQAMPTTVVLDRQGRVAARIMGQIDPTMLRGLIDDTLAERA
ncbi:TlpA family protein disulfide reductase [Georgenia satyanarayanai]|uniref:TlpA family protein disulfide reductase n=1 Tax=Georgenia satyanarayanai TaxID=860221 RepID=UPI00204236C6|nr:TlpA disulfide reductase family protein [Georgenia satyanarayanai]MCM3659808.1 TlpA family protein disulfide reductase [Georgenia satyanarayanai]